MIRPAHADDAAALADINTRGWHFAYGAYVDAETMAGASRGLAESWREQLRAPDDRRAVWVAERDGQVEGFVSAGPSRDPDAVAPVGELMAIYVDPEIVGEGVGRDLLVRGERSLVEMGFAEATLWVFEANARARRFYERGGWTLEPGSGPGPYGWAPSVRYRKVLAA